MGRSWVHKTQLDSLAHSTISSRTAVAPAGPGTTMSHLSNRPGGASGDQTPTHVCGMSRLPTYSNIERSFSSSPKQITADRKSTRLNSSHLVISYAVFCLKKKKRK